MRQDEGLGGGAARGRISRLTEGEDPGRVALRGEGAARKAGVMLREQGQGRSVIPSASGLLRAAQEGELGDERVRARGAGLLEGRGLERGTSRGARARGGKRREGAEDGGRRGGLRSGDVARFEPGLATR